MTSRLREVILPLYSTLVRLHLPVGLEPSAQRRHGPVRAGPEEATKKIRGMEHLSYEERLREAGVFVLEKRRLQGDLSVAFQSLKGTCKKDGNRVFSRACNNRIRGNDFKQKRGDLYRI